VIVARDEVPPCCGRQASELGDGDGDGDAIGDGVGDGDGVGSAGGEVLGLGVAEDEGPPGEAEPQAASKTIIAARAMAFIVHVLVVGRPGGTRMRTRLKLASTGEQGRWSLLARDISPPSLLDALPASFADFPRGSRDDPEHLPKAPG
jgi:hypothetical protein